MTEEEIIKNIKELIQWSDHTTYKLAIQGLLDLYNKEKEKNKELEIKLMEQDLFIDGLKEDRRIAVEEIQEQYYVSKDKIKKLLNKLEISDDLEAQIAIPYIRELLKERN